MQQLASDQKKSERRSFFNVAKADWDHRDCLQVIAYSKKLSHGSHRLILRRTTILPANHATPGLLRGSFRATRSQNGKRPKPRVLFCGFMGNVR